MCLNSAQSFPLLWSMDGPVVEVARVGLGGDGEVNMHGGDSFKSLTGSEEADEYKLR